MGILGESMEAGGGNVAAAPAAVASSVEGRAWESR